MVYKIWNRVRRFTLWRGGTVFEATFELLNGEWKRWGGGYAVSRYQFIEVGLSHVEWQAQTCRAWDVIVAEIRKRKAGRI